ncbi:MAG: GNAT family N-acetyltransferase [bacterium]|nr:GNAT family N-acetyltransferase [bacterium]
MPQQPKLTIRFAGEADTPQILTFIRELAEFEQLAHQVTTDEETLRRSLFLERQVAEVLIAELAGTPVGFALFFHNFSTFRGRPGLYLEDLYVKNGFRGRGIGRALLTRLAQLAVERNCPRLEWWVLDWNRDAIEFYRNLDAQSMDEWTVFRVAGEALTALAEGDIPPKRQR